MNESAELPSNVRRVPGPAVRWQVHDVAGYAFDGYVFDDDQSDLGKFFRWLAEQASTNQLRLTVTKVYRG